ncbi:MAG: S26 family signal peptidase [Haloarculaceae archaeon]
MTAPDDGIGDSRSPPVDDADDGTGTTDVSADTTDDSTASNGGVPDTDDGPDDPTQPFGGRDDPKPTPAPSADVEEGAPWSLFARDLVGSVLAVGLVGLLLFATSGVWPPMVAIESQSMTPHLQVGDLVFVMEEHRFPGDGHQGATGVVTTRAGASTGYVKFAEPGDVIVYQPDGHAEVTPIIHRARFWVADGENWYDKADPDYVGGADDCDALPNCPAPHAGFITKGDANPRYDQVGPNPFSSPVKPDWVVGTAEARVPLLGCVRLASQPNTPRCGLLSTAPSVRGAVEHAGSPPATVDAKRVETDATDSWNATAS